MALTELDVVRYDTGTTYFVCADQGAETVLVKGWKNGKPFGALRNINPARCTKIGRAIRPKTSKDHWHMIPSNIDNTT